MKKIFFCALCCALMLACNNEKPTEENTTAVASTTPQPAEFADAKYTDIGKRGIAALASGDIDAWMNDFADSAKYFWNNGDSIVGKTAITAYWKQRRTQVIDSMSFMTDMWMPVKINKPQQQVQTPGVWLLSWFQVRAKYKTGKIMSQWIHTDYHFDSNDKIDEVVQYLDRASINAAASK